MQISRKKTIDTLFLFFNVGIIILSVSMLVYNVLQYSSNIIITIEFLSLIFVSFIGIYFWRRER